MGFSRKEEQENAKRKTEGFGQEYGCIVPFLRLFFAFLRLKILCGGFPPGSGGLRGRAPGLMRLMARVTKRVFRCFSMGRFGI